MSFLTLLNFYFYRLELSKSSFNKGNDVERKDCLTGKILNEMTVIWSKSNRIIKFSECSNERGIIADKSDLKDSFIFY